MKKIFVARLKAITIAILIFGFFLAFFGSCQTASQQIADDVSLLSDHQPGSDKASLLITPNLEISRINTIVKDFSAGTRLWLEPGDYSISVSYLTNEGLGWHPVANGKLIFHAGAGDVLALTAAAVDFPLPHTIQLIPPPDWFIRASVSSIIPEPNCEYVFDTQFNYQDARSHDLAFVPGQQKVAISGRNGDILLLTGPDTHAAGHIKVSDSGPLRISSTEKTQSLFCLDANNRMYSIDTSGNTPVRVLTTLQKAPIIFKAIPTALVAVFDDGSIQSYDPIDGHLTFTQKGEDNTWKTIIGESGDILQYRGQKAMWRSSLDAPVREIVTESDIAIATVRPDGLKLVLGLKNGNVLFYDKDGSAPKDFSKLVFTPHIYSSTNQFRDQDLAIFPDIYQMGFSRDGKYFYLRNSNITLTLGGNPSFIWNPETAGSKICLWNTDHLDWTGKRIAYNDSLGASIDLNNTTDPVGPVFSRDLIIDTNSGLFAYRISNGIALSTVMVENFLRLKSASK